MNINHEKERIDTTLGDLIATVTDAALELSEDKREAYLVAGVALGVILKKARLGNTDKAHLVSQAIAEITPSHIGHLKQDVE